MGPTALDVLQVLTSKPVAYRDALTRLMASNVTQEAIKWKPIATRIEELDELLGGGLQRGELTEICMSSYVISKGGQCSLLALVLIGRRWSWRGEDAVGVS